jgi:hypothetical protein
MPLTCCGGMPLCTGLKGFGGPNGGVSGNPMYPRLVDLYRSKMPATDSTVGMSDYEGRTHTLNDFSDPSGFELLLTGIMCNIIPHGIGRATGAMLLPGDVTKRPQWRINTVVLPLYTIRDRDYLIDDEKYRYQVALNAWTMFGYNIDCVREET